MQQEPETHQEQEEQQSNQPKASRTESDFDDDIMARINKKLGDQSDEEKEEEHVTFPGLERTTEQFEVNENQSLMNSNKQQSGSDEAEKSQISYNAKPVQALNQGDMSMLSEDYSRCESMGMQATSISQLNLGGFKKLNTLFQGDRYVGNKRKTNPNESLVSDQNANESMISVFGQNRLGSEASGSAATQNVDSGPTILMGKKEILEHITEAESAKDEFSRTVSVQNSQVEANEEQDQHEASQFNLIDSKDQKNYQNMMKKKAVGEIIVILQKVRVLPPRMINNKNHYEISGYDKLGFFNGIQKRYSHFNKLFEMLNSRYQGLYVPNIPPKKMVGSKAEVFIEERRLFLQDFLVNISKYDYLWQSQEFTSFVRSTNNTDLMSKHNVSIKQDVHRNSTPTYDAALSDRISRYEDIIDGIAVVDPVFRKNCQRNTEQMKTLLVKTQKYILHIQPWFKLNQIKLKDLVEKNERWFNSNQGLQYEITEYQKAVCKKDGQNSFQDSENGRQMSISGTAVPVLKEATFEDDDDDDDKVEIFKDVEVREVSQVSKVSSNILRPTQVYEDSPLLQFQKKGLGLTPVGTYGNQVSDGSDNILKGVKEFRLKDVFDWMKLENNELLSIENSLKTYDKLEQKIKQYIIKHKYTEFVDGNNSKNPELSKSVSFREKREPNGDLDFPKEQTSRASDNVNIEESKEKTNHGSTGELSDSFIGCKEQKGNLDQLLLLQTIVLKFLACYLIPTYKRERASQYHKTLTEYVSCELQQAQNNEFVWQQVYKN